MKAIIHFTHPNGMEDEFHLQGTLEDIRAAAKHNLEIRGCDPSLAWSEEVREPHFTQV